MSKNKIFIFSATCLLFALFFNLNAETTENNNSAKDKKWIKTEIHMSLDSFNMSGGLKHSEKKVFIISYILNYFPKGISFHNATGAWKNDRGDRKVEDDKSLVIYMSYPDTERNKKRLNRILTLLKNSKTDVFCISYPVKVNFIN
ncbi:MAG: DUF3574 domain-containing protein [Victivallales bacterium]|nr:DUF3574 domain-containing protein [Victivallales bacterium]MCF7888776.1 DUF3574 domain-containing protein [Victivallales bacterium]